MKKLNEKLKCYTVAHLEKFYAITLLHHTHTHTQKKYSAHRDITILKTVCSGLVINSNFLFRFIQNESGSV